MSAAQQPKPQAIHSFRDIPDVLSLTFRASSGLSTA